jgi:hypothetical protein
MQRHRKNRTEDKERRQAKQRNTTWKTEKDEDDGPHKKLKKLPTAALNKNPGFISICVSS